MIPTRLGWAGLVFMGIALIAGALIKVDFHSPASIFAAVAVAATGLAGLCMHPPWTPQSDPEPAPANVVVVPPPAAPEHPVGS